MSILRNELLWTGASMLWSGICLPVFGEDFGNIVFLKLTVHTYYFALLGSKVARLHAIPGRVECPVKRYVNEVAGGPGLKFHDNRIA